MTTRKIFIFILLMLPQFTEAQIDSYFPSIDKTNLPDAKFSKPEVYNSTTLDEFMSEEAPLFKEYGCMDAWTCELTLSKSKFRLEIFRMFGPEEAFGIFSVLRDHCLNCKDFPPYSCRTNNKMLVSRGRYLIRILSEKDLPTDSLAFTEISQVVLGKIAEPSTGLSDYLPGINTLEDCGNIILVKGKSGLSKSDPDTEAYLKESTFSTAVIYRRDSSTTISLKFNDPEGIMKFASVHNWRTKSADQSGNLMESGEIVRVLSENQIIVERKK